MYSRYRKFKLKPLAKTYTSIMANKNHLSYILIHMSSGKTI